MLVRLFEVRAEDLVHLVGEPAAARRVPGGETVGWPPGTRCLEVALASEERDPPASRRALGEQLARIWSGLISGLVPDEPGLVHLLRLEAAWDDPAGLALLSHVAIDNRRFIISAGARRRVREAVEPLTATLELTEQELSDVVDLWGRAGGPDLTIEVISLKAETAAGLFRTEAGHRVPAGELARGLRLYMTGSRDRRSLFIISDHPVDQIRLLLEGSTGD